MAIVYLFAASWLEWPQNLSAWYRWISTAVILAALPVLVLRWLNPPITGHMLCTRLGWVANQEKPRSVSHQWVGIEGMASVMLLAALVSEDAYFFWHCGFNPVEIWRAYQYNLHERRPGQMRRGGSTISQQVAKNVFLLPQAVGRASALTAIQSYLRKMIEAVFTLLIEGLWSKRRILEMYLNVVYFGDGMFGVDDAARHFIYLPALMLNADQAALLTAALRRPQIYRVADPPDYMREIQAGILKRMAWCGEELLLQLDD